MRGTKIGYRYDLDEDLQIVQVPYHHVKYNSELKDYRSKGGRVPTNFSYRGGTLFNNDYL